jgi:hypothetical protein
MKYKQKSKISKSLKKYHNRRRMTQDLAYMLTFIAIIIITGATNQLVRAYNDTETAKASISHDLIEKRTEGQIEAKNDIPEAEPKTVEEQIRAIAEKECEKRGLAEYCIKDILSMAWVESRLNPNAIGDGGKSHGILQIHLGYHKHVTVEQAQDIEFSIKWTLDRMTHYGYPEYRSYAIRRHNGSATNPLTLNYLQKVNNSEYQKGL